MNDIKMQWKFKKGKQIKPAIVPEPVYMTDEWLNFLARRYQANRICFLLDITFGAYLKAPKGWDRLAKHMNDGGGCRMVAGELVVSHA